MPNLAPSQNTSSAIVETKGIVGKDTAGGELPQSSAHKEVQKEWTCAVCQVTTSSEKNLNSHLNGRKHKATCEALKAKNQPIPQKLKNFQSKEELKQKNIINHHSNIEQKNIQISHAKEHAQTSREPEKSMLDDALKQGTTKSQGSKRIYVVSVDASANKTDQLNAKTMNGESIVNNGLKGKAVVDHKVQELQKNLGQPVWMNPSKLRCEICNVTCTSEGDMASHLNGNRHFAQIQN